MKKILAFGLLMLALTFGLGYADDVQRGARLVLYEFTGGLVTKASPYLLKPTQATVAENVRFDSKYGSISNRTNLNTYGSADPTEPITGMHRQYLVNGEKVLLVTHGDELEKGADDTGVFTKILDLAVGDHKWQWVSWHNIAIGTDGYNRPVKYDGSSASATYLGSLLALDAGSGSGPASGAYSYKVSCYSTTYEILLNSASNTFTANGNDVALSMIPICNDTTLNGEATIGRKIYRTESGGSTYKLLSNGTVANNTAVTLTDSDADGALGAAYPAGDATWAPPLGRFILIQNNRLWLANDPASNPSRIFYSSDSSHDVFDTSNSVGYFDIRKNDGDVITFVKGVLGILTIGKNNSIQKIYIDGDDPDADWSVSDPFSYVGCQAPYSVANSPLGIIYLAKDGLYRFQGQYSELLSESITPTMEDISPTDMENTWGIYHDNLYLLSYQSKESAESLNNRVLVLDVLAKAFSIDTLKINAFTAFNSGNDWGILYAGSSENGNVYAYADEVNEIVHKRQSDFAGQWDDMRYIPESVGGDVNSPILEIARTETIDELLGTIDDLVGIIDRQDTEGYYVSQPLLIGASELDKIYWNEVIPASGGNVIFKVRTSPTGESNLLYNDDFEFWDNWVTGTPSTEQPNDWSFTQDGAGGSADQSTTEVKRGTYSVKITKSDSGQSYVSFSIPNATSYQSKTLAFSGWAKSANSVASKVRFQITDGFTTTTTNYANGGAWEELEGTIAVNAAATAITFKAVVETGADAVAYFDRVMVRQASSVANDWSAWSSAMSNSAGSDISGVSSDEYIQYLINMTTSVIDYTPTVVRLGQYNVRLTYLKEGTPLSNTIPMVYETGWIDLGDSTRPKIIRGMEAFYTGTTGTVTITLTNFEGDEESWEIPVSEGEERYAAVTRGSGFVGKVFKLTIEYSEPEPFTLDKVVLVFDVEPYVAGQ